MRNEYTLDYSTLNLDRLHKQYPVYKKPATYTIDSNLGLGCFMDAPGYPSYFVQSVSTQYGNPLAKGVTTVIYDPQCGHYHAVASVETPRSYYERMLKKLWKPLPIDHMRVRLWMMAVYQYQNNCYYTPWENRISGHSIVFPNALYTKQTGTMFSKERAEITRALAAGCITPDNHMAVRIIRRFYPEHIPNIAYIATPPQASGSGWWETSNSMISEITGEVN